MCWRIEENPRQSKTTNNFLTTGGRALAAQLEHLRLYHQERGFLGKRYISVIREFAPDYTPRTSNDLARLSEKVSAVVLS